MTINQKILDALEKYSNKIKNVLISYNDVVNNCVSTSTTKPLSANQGKQLQDQINSINGGNLIASSSGTAPLISENADLNTYTTPGVYVISSDSVAGTVSNAPCATSGKLIVIDQKNDATYISQIYIPTTSMFTTYMRTKYADTWANWATFQPANLKARTDFRSIDVRSLMGSSQYVSISNASLKLVGQRMATLYISGTTKSAMSAGTWYNLFTLPSKLRAVIYSGCCTDNYTGALFEDGRFAIVPRQNYGQGASIYLTATYILANDYT